MEFTFSNDILADGTILGGWIVNDDNGPQEPISKNVVGNVLTLTFAAPLASPLQGWEFVGMPTNLTFQNGNPWIAPFSGSVS